MYTWKNTHAYIYLAYNLIIICIIKIHKKEVGIFLIKLIPLFFNCEKEAELGLMGWNYKEVGKFQFIKRKKFLQVKAVQKWNKRRWHPTLEVIKTEAAEHFAAI